MDEEALVGLLRSRLDGLLAVYAFGSRVQGTADEEKPRADHDFLGCRL